MQMNGLAELITIAKYRERWADQRLIVLVLNNRDLNQVTWEQRAMSGDPKFVASQELPDFPYARWAELLGLNGIRVDDPDAVGDCLGRALAADRPTVLEVVTDPEVPPLPPHITLRAGHGRSPRRSGTGDPGSRRIDHPVAAPEAARSSCPADEASCGCWRTCGAGARSARWRPRRPRSALPLGLEIYFEHFRGSFGDKWMWTPVALSPLLTRRRRSPACASERAATTVLPARLGAVLPRRR